MPGSPSRVNLDSRPLPREAPHVTDVAPGDLLPVMEPVLRAALSSASHEVLLASPYLGAATTTWLRGAAEGSPASWRLLTALDPVAAAYGSLHLAGVRNLLKAGVEVRHAPRLHAKVFLVDGHTGFLGSANLTGAGLGSVKAPNLELSAALTAEQIAAAQALVQDWWDSATVVTEALLKQVEDQARRVQVHSAPPPQAVSGSHPPAQPDAQRLTQEAADALLHQSLDVTVWVKAVYASDNPDQMGWPQDGWISNAGPHQPSIADGDLLVLYVRGHGVCNAVLQATSNSFHDPELVAADEGDEAGQRWPWVNRTSVRVEVPVALGVPVGLLGLSGQSLQKGYCHMPTGGLATALRHLVASMG